MKIFVLTSVFPFRGHGEPGVTATHIVTGALIRELQSLGHTIVLQCIWDQSRKNDGLSAIEEVERAWLSDCGITVLPQLSVGPFMNRKPQHLRTIRLLFQPQRAIEHFYPGMLLSPTVRKRINEHHPDSILPLWSPQGVAASHSIESIPRVVFQGDIDMLPMESRHIIDPLLFFGRRRLNFFTPFALVDHQLRLHVFRRAHIALMRQVDVIANITEMSRIFYEECGHKHSKYVRTTWIDPGPPPKRPPSDITCPFKIIGHVGYLDRTGSTYGLRFLLRDVLPHLELAFGGRPFEVHIIGGGEPVPCIRELLNHPRIIRHGFVKDLDSELHCADVFCLFNNAGPYVAAYTRHVVAWSMGLCLVTHTRSKLAIPELEHGKNALLAGSGEEGAQMIARAALDTKLNAKLREGGRHTYEECFAPAVVARRIEQLMWEVIDKKRKSVI